MPPPPKSNAQILVKPVKLPATPLTIADLPEVERAKVSRLVERLVTLGKEHEETVGKLAALQASSKKDSIDAQGRNEADVERLTAVITAIEAQRTSAFKMLMQYQLRIEQLTVLMKQMDEDSISGDRKVAFLANMRQLENIVENQKTMIIGFQRERTNTENSHKQELVLAHESIKRSEAEARKQMDMMLRAERRTSAIEMACSRLTKQITEMTRRDSFKQAEIDALKRLLTEGPVNQSPPIRSVSNFTGSTTHTGTGGIPGGIPTHTNFPADTDSAAGSDASAFETSAFEPKPLAYSSSKERETSSIDVGNVGADTTTLTNTKTAAFSAPVPPSPPRSYTASPKRKLSTALHSSRGEPVPVEIREPPAAKVEASSVSTTSAIDLVNTIATLVATPEVPATVSPRRKALTTYTGSPVKRNQSSSRVPGQDGEKVAAVAAEKDPSTPSRSVKSSTSKQSRASKQSNKSVQTSTVKPLKVDRRERKAELEAERQRVMERRKAKLFANAQEARAAARDAAAEEKAARLTKVADAESSSDKPAKSKKEDKEIEVEKQSAPPVQRLIRTQGIAAPPAPAVRRAKATSVVNKTQPVRSPRPKLNILLGENKLYDPVLLDLLDDMEFDDK